MRALRDLVLIQRFVDLLIDWHAIDSLFLSTFSAEPLVRSNIHLSLIGLRLRRVIVDKLILILLGGRDISIYCFSKK
jgi:hypothetical protein